MDYNIAAVSILKYIGGKSNIVTMAHCATRLRIVIADHSLVRKKEIENIEGVKGVFEASGQLQIILGTGVVNKVYDELVTVSGVVGGTKEDVKEVVASKQNIFLRAIKGLGDVFVPIIPAIVASGLLMGLLEGLVKIFPTLADSGTYTILYLFSNAAFVFLPILIAASGAKVFGGNIFLGAVIGMIMIHTGLINAWAAVGMLPEEIPQATAWFGLYKIDMIGYQGHVIPIVIAVWFMSWLEKKLHKIVPEIIDLFVTPLVTVVVTGYLALTVFGPIFAWLENYVLVGIQWLITIPFGIGAFLAGAVYAPTVVTGVHHMYNALEASMLSANGMNTWMPIATAANVAQGAAALALSLKTRDQKLRALAFPASLSAFLGITEPAIFGVNIRYFKAFIAGMIGGAVGSLVGSMLNVYASAYGVTGVFGLLITTSTSGRYIILMVVSFAVAFGLSWIMFRDPIEEDKIKDSKHEAGYIVSPMSGQVIDLSEVNDSTFASELVGKGMAIVPDRGEVYSPIDGTVSSVFDSKHAIGITTEDGIDLLIHVGINTVELNGQFFETSIVEGDLVKRGQKLLSFNLNEIKAAGYDITTPILITNPDKCSCIERIAGGDITVGDTAIRYTK